MNIDLWWAVRGGTGGNFGVLLSVRYQLRPLGQVFGWALIWPLQTETDFDNATGAHDAAAVELHAGEPDARAEHPGLAVLSAGHRGRPAAERPAVPVPDGARPVRRHAARRPGSDPAAVRTARRDHAVDEDGQLPEPEHRPAERAVRHALPAAGQPDALRRQGLALRDARARGERVAQPARVLRHLAQHAGRTSTWSSTAARSARSRRRTTRSCTAARRTTP